MFAIEVLIGAEDVQDEARMKQHRDSLDGGALADQPQCAFLNEEILPYIEQVVDPETRRVRDLPETTSTRRYLVLRRTYG